MKKAIITLILFYGFFSTVNAENKKDIKNTITPKIVTATKSGRGQKITLEWSPVKGAKDYAVLRSISAENNFQQIAVTEQTTYEDVHQQKDKLLYYRIQVNSYNEITAVDESEAIKTRAGLYGRAVVPGWAQFYSGHTTRGIIYSCGFGVSAITMSSLFIYSVSTRNDYEKATSGFDDKWDKHSTVIYTGWGFAGLTIAFYLANWVDVLFFHDDFTPDMELELNVHNRMKDQHTEPRVYWAFGTNPDGLNFQFTKKF